MSGAGVPAANTRGAAAKQQAAPPAAAAGDAAAVDPADADEGKAGEQSPAPQEAPGADAAAAAAAGDADRVELANMRQLMQAMQEKIARLEQGLPAQQAPPLSLDAPAAAQAAGSDAAALNGFAAILRTMQDNQAALMRQQAAAQADQMRAYAAQQNALSSMGDPPTFSGKGADTTLTAHDWLQRLGQHYAAREQVTGITAAEGDQARLLGAVNALTDTAGRWYNALPSAMRPTSWKAFGDAIRARFCSVPSERIRADKLHEFVDKAARTRDKLTVQGMQLVTAQFAQLAGEVPDDLMTLRAKLAMLARCVPQRYAEVVLKEEAKKPTPALHEVINTVLSRAANKEQAVAYGGGSSSSGSASASVDAVSLAAMAAHFGWTAEEAAAAFENDEGWEEHDTSGSQRAPSSAAAFAGAGRIPDDQMAMLVNAVAAAARVGAGPVARERNAGSRRNVPGGIRKEVSKELADARQEAGLCIRCGIAKYEPGGKGHNSVTCKAPVDKTTSVAEGKRKAGF